MDRWSRKNDRASHLNLFPPRRLAHETPSLIAALQAVLSEDFKAREIEVGLVDARDGQGGRFRVLSDAEVDEHLVALAERD